MNDAVGPGTQWVLYGSPISLFTMKLDAALRFSGLAFRSERRTEDNRSRLERRAGTHQIPVLETPNGWLLADTTPIMIYLGALSPARRLFPEGPVGVLVHVLEEVLDEWVARAMVHYRWHYDENTRAVIDELEGVEHTCEEARAHRLAAWGLRACRATGTEHEDAQRACEREYLGLVGALEAQLGRTRYALGDRPCAVDAALIGGLRAHTLRDPLPDLREFPRVCRWAEHALDWDGAGELAAFPDSTPFAAHLLELAEAQYRPFVLGNAAALRRGEKAFVCETWGREVSYLCRPYPEVSRQMVVHRLRHALADEEKQATAAWLDRVGLGDCFRHG